VLMYYLVLLFVSVSLSESELVLLFATELVLLSEFESV